MFTYDGQPIPDGEGQTIAAALLKAGRRPRVFCGIGICFECVVTVNGKPGQRACLAIARPGDRVES